MKNLNLRNIDRNYLLGLMGLEPKTTFVDWIFPAVGIFAAGLVVGAGLGGYFANPRLIENVRSKVRNRLEEASNVVGSIGGRSATGEMGPM